MASRPTTEPEDLRPRKSARAPRQPSPPRPERRDKARNRAKVLDAAATLFSERGVEHVTVDDVARSAGVGVGTIYRTFGDKGGLVAAILDERERTLQDQLLSGPPPLGPGAPDKARVEAFLAALAALVEDSYEMLIISENNTLGARYRIGSYQAWRLHLTTLLKAHVEDPALTADALLAPLAADLYRHQRKELGISAKRIHAAVQRVAAGLF
jgi:AcrR family transcriptional regulator